MREPGTGVGGLRRAAAGLGPRPGRLQRGAVGTSPAPQRHSGVAIHDDGGRQRDDGRDGRDGDAWRQRRLGLARRMGRAAGVRAPQARSALAALATMAWHMICAPSTSDKSNCPEHADTALRSFVHSRCAYNSMHAPERQRF